MWDLGLWCIPDGLHLVRWAACLQGLMLVMRAMNRQFNLEGDVVRTFLSDSSPVGLENWQITECYVFTKAIDVRRKARRLGLVKIMSKRRPS